MNIEVNGLDEVIERMRAYPEKLKRVLAQTLEAILLFIWSKVPPYPAPPPASTYVRTGTLGRSLGSGMGGGQGGGQPDIYETREDGGYMSARFGTRLGYAPYVVGDSIEEQARHMRHWWTIPQTLKWIALEGATKLMQTAVDQMAAWLKGANNA